MKFRKYQVEGIKKWEALGYNGGIFWVPGLGKTFVAAEAISQLVNKGVFKKVLILAPKVMLSDWKEELKIHGVNKAEIFKHTSSITFSAWPKKKVLQFIKVMGLAGIDTTAKLSDLKESILKILPSIKKYNVSSKKLTVRQHNSIRYFSFTYPNKMQRYLVMSYSGLSTHPYPEKLFKDVDLIVADESHYINNYSSNIYKLIAKNKTAQMKFLALSGTPFNKKLIDSWAIMNLIHKGSLGKNITEFRALYCTQLPSNAFVYVVVKAAFPKIKKIINKYCSFAGYEQLNLKEKSEIKIYTGITTEQETMLKKLAKGIITNKGKDIPVSNVGIRNLFARQIANGIMDATLTHEETGKDIKIYKVFKEGLNNNLEAIKLWVDKREGEQHIIWVNQVAYAEQLHKFLPGSALIIGKTSRKEREKILKNYASKKINTLIANPITIGIGLNIFSNTQFSLWADLTYNYAVFEQANARTYRRGQEKPVFIYYLLNSSNPKSIKQKVIGALKGKKKIVNYVGDLK